MPGATTARPGAPARRELAGAGEVDLLATCSPLVASRHDPTIRVRAGTLCRAARTPEGPGALGARRVGDRFEVEAHGPGAAWLLDHAPGLLGLEDHPEYLRADGPAALARAARRAAGLRLTRSGQVEDVLVPTILGQRVTAVEAARSWTRLVRAHGEPAPGPYGLTLPPAPQRLAGLPDDVWHRLGVERARARAIREACRRIARLRPAADPERAGALELLQAVPGVGPWTAALVRRAAAGDPDAVEVGDFHCKHQVAWALAGEPRGTDARMLTLLAPFAGQRGRVMRLLAAAGPRPPTFGPRARIVPVESL